MFGGNFDATSGCLTTKDLLSLSRAVGVQSDRWCRVSGHDRLRKLFEFPAVALRLLVLARSSIAALSSYGRRNRIAPRFQLIGIFRGFQDFVLLLTLLRLRFVLTFKYSIAHLYHKCNTNLAAGAKGFKDVSKGFVARGIGKYKLICPRWYVILTGTHKLGVHVSVPGIGYLNMKFPILFFITYIYIYLDL